MGSGGVQNRWSLELLARSTILHARALTSCSSDGTVKGFWPAGFIAAVPCAVLLVGHAPQTQAAVQRAAASSHGASGRPTPHTRVQCAIGSGLGSQTAIRPLV